jgi:crotonobetainyl-CoA:carnitine CoA-transferase CaiB-like acyl-CoA transferase
VIQAMGGLMARTRSGDVPVKVGASAADVLGGQAALFALVAALVDPSRLAGACVEIAMQDVAVWSSLFAAGNAEAGGEALACRDGHVWISHTGPDHAIADRLKTECAASTREQAIEHLAALGRRAVSIVRVEELLADPDFAIDVLTVGRDNNGRFWPLLNVPYRLSKTPAMVRTVPSTQEREPQCVQGDPFSESILSGQAPAGDCAWPSWRSPVDATGQGQAPC